MSTLRDIPNSLRILIFSLALTTLVVISPTASRSQDQPSSRGGESGTIASFDGVWDTSYDRLILAQEGSKVRGTYNYVDGHLEGTVTGMELIFRWVEAGDGNTPLTQGTGSFVMNSDRRSFTGTWEYGNTGSASEWNGVLNTSRVVEGTRPEVEYCLWRGTWETDGGAIAFSQEAGSKSVTGVFANAAGEGTLEGSAEGWTISFTWQTADASGSGSFEMGTDVASFTGSFLTENGETQYWSGRFQSATLMADFSGRWSTTWGNIDLTQDQSTGVVSGSSSRTMIDGKMGQMRLEGRVIGETCTMAWTLTAQDGTTLTGRVSVRLAGMSVFHGTWGLDSENGLNRKLSGVRSPD
jgi:hypothetical protein